MRFRQCAGGRWHLQQSDAQSPEPGDRRDLRSTPKRGAYARLPRHSVVSPSAASVAGLSTRDPWLCGPASRRVCVYRQPLSWYLFSGRGARVLLRRLAPVEWKSHRENVVLSTGRECRGANATYQGDRTSIPYGIERPVTEARRRTWRSGFDSRWNRADRATCQPAILNGWSCQPASSLAD